MAMIEQATVATAGTEVALIVLPNRSLTRNGMFWFAALQTSTMLAVAVYSAFKGNIFAPLFALLEAGWVGYCLRLVWRRSAGGEVISFSADAVEVTRIGAVQGPVARFNPHWMRVNLQPGERRNSRTRLLLESHGRRIEIGAFLADDERKALALRLTKLLAGATSVDVG
ncbi:DUF2244 domain-containing protein [Pseudolysobacter antarcticus]|uniref:DUF2244 domain-containing protein n=2 Tax=Pseudolysobacter antarcticus TaxID=2511995 RepID=A0A411HP12_9GAMM|nr:DUF2244 domain-containing protein [Pseudolysobacter antarcticus]